MTTVLSLYVVGPRFWQSNATDGGFIYIGWDTSTAGNPLVAIAYYGQMNPTLNDGTNSPMNSAASGVNFYFQYSIQRSGSYVYWYDNLGRETGYVLDSADRVIERGEWTGSTTLLTQQQWDADNNLISATDARGKETDYAFDGNGDTIAVALPATTSNGSYFRPTALYSYDGNFNVTAYCDPYYTHYALNADWNSASAASDSLCPTTAGSASQPGPQVFNFSYPSYEPYGELTQIHKTYGETISYSYGQGGSDYGLPTDVAGATIPHDRAFTYDSSGNILTQSDSGNAPTRVTYDNLNRPVTVTDPDGITSYSYYYPNGQISKTETAYQHQYNMGVPFSYDVNGNEISEVHHYGCGPNGQCSGGTTTKWYDGEDRLIEVMQPGTWLTRYDYDQTMGQSVSLGGGQSFSAYGNLYKTQEYYGSWRDIRGSAFDAVDRVIAKYAYVPCDYTTNNCPNGSPNATTLSYDASQSWLGLLASSTNAVGQATNYAYDEDGRTSAITFTGDGGVTPGRNVTFDADGRQLSVASSVGTQSYTYDWEGRLTQQVQPLPGGSAGTISYTYQDDGLRSSLSVASPLFSSSPLKQWTYTPQGWMSSLTEQSQAFQWGYSAAGRETSYQDPYNTASRAYDQTNGQMTSYTIAQGSYSNIVHDFEGNPLTQLAYGGQTETFGYNASNQLASQTYSPGLQDDAGNNVWPDHFDSLVNGVLTQSCHRITCEDSSDKSQKFIDYGSGASLGDQEGAFFATCPSPASGCQWQVRKSLGYDAASRQTSGTATFSDHYACALVVHGQPAGYNNCYDNGTGSYTASYDAENHLLGKTYSNYPICDSPTTTLSGSGPLRKYNGASHYIYGPAGRAISVNGASVLWDGETVLFTSGPSGVDLKFDLLADQTGSQLTVWDRDPSGMVVGEHSAAGVSGWQPPSPYHTCFVPQITNAPGGGYIGPAGGGGGPQAGLSSPGSDGYFDGDIVIQGVRAYDPQLQAWTSPDEYAGDVHDPLSQKSFVWNGNNPEAYSDPSGYNPVAAAAAIPVVEIALGDALIAVGAGTAGAALVKNGSDILKTAGKLLNTNSNTTPNPQSGAAPSVPKATAGDNPYEGPVSRPVIAVDSHGNAIPVGEGERIGASPDGQFQQVKKGDKPTGVRMDRGGHPNQPDPSARGPHAHRPGVTQANGNPHLPIP